MGDMAMIEAKFQALSGRREEATLRGDPVSPLRWICTDDVVAYRQEKLGAR